MCERGEFVDSFNSREDALDVDHWVLDDLNIVFVKSLANIEFDELTIELSLLSPKS